MSDAWLAIFAVDDSIPLFAAILAVGTLFRSGPAIAFAGAGLLHLAADPALHNDDARQHLWPLTDWVYASPVSYWDPAHHGLVVAPIETGAALALCALLWRRHRSTWMHAAIAALRPRSSHRP